MIEFQYGDRVRWTDSAGRTSYGSVVDDRHPLAVPLGSFNKCLPLPVAVLWDDVNEVWWAPGEELDLA